MKRLLMVLLCLGIISNTAFAAIGVKDQGVNEGEATSINFTTDLDVTNDGSTFTVSHKPAAQVALTPGAAVTLTVAAGNRTYTDTPTDNQDQTITFSGAGSAGDVVTIVFTTVGTADEVITFEPTLVSSVGTLTLGTTAARFYTIRFQSNGTHWYELSRTAVQT